MRVIHLTSSRFYGGPERQMLGLAEHLPAGYETTFVSFAEHGLARAFLDVAESYGFLTQVLRHDTPHFRAAVRELADELRERRTDVLCCHGYKADLLGQLAARRAGVPVMSVSRGWTYESLKVRLYEFLDRRALRSMDQVICVSEGQARKVRRAGVRKDRVRVIHNAIRLDRFPERDAARRRELESLFPTPPRRIVLAAGRLSPEKGMDVLIAAAADVIAGEASVGFVIFGDGFLKPALENQIERLKLQDHVRLAGFRADLDQLLPSADVLALPSHTEGLPNIVLEAFAAAVPVVATAVGGVPELVEEGATGHLVDAGSAEQLASAIRRLLESDERRTRFGQQGHRKVAAQFTFSQQAAAYIDVFERLAERPSTNARRHRHIPANSPAADTANECMTDHAAGSR